MNDQYWKALTLIKRGKVGIDQIQPSFNSFTIKDKYDVMHNKIQDVNKLYSSRI